MRRIYVASSWRNPFQPEIVAALRAADHEVYDFRHPSEGGPPTDGALDDGFRWLDIDPEWQYWDGEAFREKVTTHPLAEAGFKQDRDGLAWADTCVLVLPCGRSAHLEAGWAAGAGKRLVILLLVQLEPELMYRFADKIVTTIPELLAEI